MRMTLKRAASVRRSAASPRSGTCGILAAVALTALSACSGTPGTVPPTATVNPTLPPNASSAPAATPFPVFQRTPPAFTSAQAELGAIVWTTSVDSVTNTPQQPVPWFSEEADAIYAAVPILRLDQATVVTATWTYNDTPVEPLTSQVTATAEYVDAWIAFRITRAEDTPWPTGIYQISVSVGGVQAIVSQVEVREAAAG